MFSAEISIDGATGLLLTSCAASKEGKFAVSGGAFDSRGQAVSFIAFLDNTGRTQKVQRQSNFAITRLHFDGDSRLWAVGSAPAMMRKKGDPMDLLVRVFTAEGTLTESIDIPYAYDSGKLYRPAIASHVGSTGKGLVILSPYWRELIFVAPGGGEVKKRSFEDPPNTRMITGFAVSGASIFISVQGKDPSGGPRNVYSIHRWNDASGNWDKADFGSPTGQHAILGALDDKLLAYTRSDVLWLPVAAQLSPQ